MAAERPVTAMRRALAVLVCLPLLAAPFAAAQQGPSEQVKAMAGTWEMSNADRDRICNLNFKLDPAAGGYALEADKTCADAFPAIRDIANWSFGKQDTLSLNDAKGKPVLELLEVEAGMYEGLRPNEERYFLQNAALAAASRDRTPDQMFGEWAFTRAGKPICPITLANVAADADNFALALKPGCDQVITRFGPTAWTMSRGQLVMKSASGAIWRFEEFDQTTWQRVPATRDAPTLVRK